MSSLTPVEKRAFEILFGMSSGYVLDDTFSNQSFDNFFLDVLGISIYQDKYAKYGESKAKRLRAFWDIEPDEKVGKVLAELMKFYDLNVSDEVKVKERDVYKNCQQIVQKLLGKSPSNDELTEEQFLSKEFPTIPLNNLDIDSSLVPILQERLSEAQRCLQAGAPLAVIFLCGSVLEGALLGVASRNSQRFNQSSASPKRADGKVKPFYEWSLSQFIDVACDLGFLTLDVKKFSHALRDFRNYIHPYQQMSQNFMPTQHTAEICCQVLKAAIAGLSIQSHSSVKEVSVV